MRVTHPRYCVVFTRLLIKNIAVIHIDQNADLSFFCVVCVGISRAHKPRLIDDQQLSGSESEWVWQQGARYTRGRRKIVGGDKSVWFVNQFYCKNTIVCLCIPLWKKDSTLSWLFLNTLKQKRALCLIKRFNIHFKSSSFNKISCFKEVH